MNWEYVVYRVSHGVHFAVKQCVADLSPQEPVTYVRVQKAYPRRYVRSITAPIQVIVEVLYVEEFHLSPLLFTSLKFVHKMKYKQFNAPRKIPD